MFNNSFNAVVDNFINEAGATITAFGECNIVATTSYADNGTITCQGVVLDTMVIDIVAPVMDCSAQFINPALVQMLPLVTPVTCNRIRDASLPAVILGLAATTVLSNWAVPPPALLFKIVPYGLTSKLST